MAEGGGAAASGGTGANYRLSATLEMNDQLTGKLRGAASQLKSIDSAVSKLGNHGEVAKLAKQFDSLNDLRKQVNQFKQLKKTVSATQQAYNEANASTAQMAKQYKSGQSVVAQLTAKHDELKDTFNTSQAATAQLKDKLSGLKVEAAKFKNSGATEQYQKLQNQIKATSAEMKASRAMTRSTSAELKTLAGGVKQAQGELNNIGKAFEQSKAKAAQFKQELKTQQPMLNRMRQSLAAQGFSTANFAASEMHLRRQMESVRQRLRAEQLRSTLTAAGMTMSSPKSIPVNVSGNATTQLGKIKKELQTLTGKAWNVAVNAKSAVGNRMNGLLEGAAFGMGAQMLGTAGVGYGIVDTVETYRKFEKQIKRNTALATPGMSAEESAAAEARFEAAARYYGATTPLTAEEVGKAQEYAIIAGWDQDKILGQSFKDGAVRPVAGAEGALKPIIQASIASGENLALVSDIITDSMTAMGYEADRAQHYVDTLMKTTVSANTNFQQIGLAMKYAAPMAHTLGYNVEDVSIALGLMANSGIKADQAGTGLRGILTRLAKPPKQTAAALDALGISMADSSGNAKGLMATMMELRSKFKGGDAGGMLDFVEQLTGETVENKGELTDFLKDAQARGGLTNIDKAKLAGMTSGQYALSAFMAIMNASDKDIKTLMSKVYNADGTTQEMFDKMSQTLDFDIEAFKAAFSELQIEMMSGTGGSGLRGFFQALTEDVNHFKNSLKDGFDIGDVGSLLAKVVTQLKDKFLQLDGIGSVLAGGALVMGLKKIYDLATRVKSAVIATRSWWQGAATGGAQSTRQTGGIQNRPGVGGVAQSVGTMNVRAGVVHLNGKVAGGTPTTTAGGTNRSGIAGGGTNRTTTPSPTPTPASRVATGLKVAGGTAALTGVFALLDAVSVRSTNADRCSEAESAVKAAQDRYNEVMQSNAESRAKLLPKATQDLDTATQNLKAIQKETAQHNNESLFGGTGAVAGAAAGAAIGSIIPGAGTAVGAVTGLILGSLGAYLGSEGGKVIGEKFDYDVLDRITGKSGKTAEPIAPKADWKTSDGRMFSEYSAADKVRYWRNENTADRASREAAESAAQQQAAQQRHDTRMQEWQNGASGDAALASVSKDTINSQIEARRRQREATQIGLTTPTDRGHSATALSMLESPVKAVQEASLESIRAKVQNEIEYVKSLFKGRKEPDTNHLGIEKSKESRNIQEANQLGTDFWSSIKDSVVSAFTPRETEVSGGQHDHLGFETPSMKSFTLPEFDISKMWSEFNVSDFLPDLNISQWLSDLTSGVEIPNLSQMWANFNVTDFLPDIDISQWLSESTVGLEVPDLSQMWTDFSTVDMLPNLNISEWFAETMGSIEMPDISTLLPDVSSISTMLSESLTGIPESISNVASLVSEGFSQIPTAASEAFSTIATAASESWTNIQTEWSQVPSFFNGLWAGAGSAASAAGAAIAAGINSAIGTIKSAWEGLSSWLSAKISSLASMASNAISSITSFGGGGGVGHNATGTASWRGGFTEINEQGGEIIDLPSGARIYPHATTMKMLQSDMENGAFDGIGGYSSEGISLSNDMLTMSGFPEALQVGELASGLVNNTTATTNTNNNNNGVTVSGNTFNVRAESDIDKIAFRLFEMMADSNANYANA